MSEEPESPRPSSRRPPAGLCDSCAHQRLIRNTRGSEFSMCERSQTDPAYSRYPRLPVLECLGYELAPRPPEPPVLPN